MKATHSLILLLTTITVNTTTYQEFFKPEEEFYLDCYKRANLYTAATPATGDYLGYSDQNYQNFLARKYLLEITQNDTTKAKKLYDLVLELYADLSIFDNKINPYHNACHGFMTMIIAGELYKQIRNVEVTNDTYSNDTYRAILYSGLMHDIGHPGVGNVKFTKDNTFRNNFVIKINLLAGTQITDRDLKKEGETSYSLEYVHWEIAKINCDNFLITCNTSMKKMIEDSIVKTNMVHHFGLKSIGNYNNAPDLFVHFADIAASASQNQVLMLLLAKGVLTEFFVESYQYPSMGLCGWIKDQVFANKKEIAAGLAESQNEFIKMFLLGIKEPVGILDFLPEFEDPANKLKTYYSFENGEKNQEINIQKYFAINVQYNITEKGINAERFFIDLDFLSLIPEICKPVDQRNVSKNVEIFDKIKEKYSTQLTTRIILV